MMTVCFNMVSIKKIYCIDSPNPDAITKQAEIDLHKSVFFASGGKIQVIPDGVTAEGDPKQKQTISRKQRMRDEGVINE